MAKVHITLVGGQPTPVYQGVVLSTPDRIILICSGQTKNRAKEIQEQLKALKYYNVQIEVFPTEDTKPIIDKLKVLFSTLALDDKLSMNLSGGLKIWSLLCLQCCPKEDTDIYCISQNGKMLSIRGSYEDQVVEFDMFTQFALLGHPLEHYNKFSDYTAVEEENFEVISSLYSNGLFQNLIKKMRAEEQQNRSFFMSDQSIIVNTNDNHYIEWHKDDKVFAISLGEEDRDYYEVKGEHAVSMLAHTGWFEYEVAAALARLYGSDNVYTNCVFKTQHGQDKNEVDIIVNTGQKLLFVECKTDIHESTAIDKFASVVKNYGGNGSKALFITLFEINDNNKEKCCDNHIENYYMRYNDQKNQRRKLTITDAQLQQKINTFITIANE